MTPTGEFNIHRLPRIGAVKRLAVALALSLGLLTLPGCLLLVGAAVGGAIVYAAQHHHHDDGHVADDHTHDPDLEYDHTH